ncbi:Vacuolar protein-sorting-associated protein 27 [Coemansia erecta]|uniref:Vacuolar protein sorting-associated protein 27 n=1 Tax=Coemansia erecta TaxID=147472 RepID=A0A9W7Y5L5_9FUNG|nr:Vacuolar protein-sorting-associated protein 27 [Coemansia erecta]
MVARLFYGSPIEDEVNRLTAEDVPNHELDMTGALNFADRIRSKEFSAKDVARVLRKRLEYSNPNVQILVLSLSDICIKNGGSLIQLEISRREFIDDVAGILESKTGREYELRQLVLKLIQEWAALFRNNIEMGYACGVYDRLKRTGYTFPRLDMAASGAMIETSSAPEWEDSPVCQRCRTQFTFTNRKHHCRHCGKCFCNDCSSNTSTIPKFAIYDPVRVCHGCYLRLKKIVSDSDSSPADFGQNSYGNQRDIYRSNSVSTPRPAVPASNTVDEDDEDLKRAIELSIQESQKRPNYADFTSRPIASGTFSSSSSRPEVSNATATSTMSPVQNSSGHRYPTVAPSEPHPLVSASANNQDDEDNDPDLLAAIEASLRDVPGNGVPDYISPPQSQFSAQAHHGGHFVYPSSAGAGNGTNMDEEPPMTAFMPADSLAEDDNSDPLSSMEKENVQLFESLLVRIRDSGQDIRNDPQIQYLHESIEKLHPRITEAIEGVDQKNKEFSKLHDRIVTAIKIYDQLLDKRLRPSSYVAPSASASDNMSYLPSQQSVYPSASAAQPPAAPFAQPVQAMQYHSPAPDSQYIQQTQPTPQTQHQPQYLPQQHQHPQQQQPSQIQQQSSYSATPLPPADNAAYSVSSGYAPNMSYLPAPNANVPPVQSVQQEQPQPYAQHVQQQAASVPRSPQANPYYAPPPAVPHVPSIPVLQPTPAHVSAAAASASPTHVQSPAPSTNTNAGASVQAPEEAPLIEF